jgi:DNA-binding GntR family transcriptional regulator
MGPAELAALRETVERMEVALESDNLSALTEEVTRFHNLLRSGSKHARLPNLLSLLHVSFGSLGARQLHPDRVEPAIREHRAIMEAVLARDGETAERLAREHTQHALQAQIRAHHLMDGG